MLILKRRNHSYVDTVRLHLVMRPRAREKPSRHWNAAQCERFEKLKDRFKPEACSHSLGLSHTYQGFIRNSLLHCFSCGARERHYRQKTRWKCRWKSAALFTRNFHSRVDLRRTRRGACSMVPHEAGDRCTLQYRHDKLSHGCRNIHVFGFYTGSRETRAQRKKH